MRAVLEVLPQVPTKQEIDDILVPLRQYNRPFTQQYPSRNDIGIVLRHPESGKILGGLFATDEFNWLFVKYLAVSHELRGAGCGTALMNEAERVARDRGYIGIFLDTFDFQTRPFYEKLGYKLFGELEGGEDGPRRFFLKKRFEVKN
ncbi:GNAT family N-acetyltransferase [Oryzifoliimicrobium ureilyticus]|uniref:GNAT family N-acetyltransferase n=1 Tax=Oryzifoliimicrobium ureilyticus TaxID=3113724 RepID=UPI0030766806